MNASMSNTVAQSPSNADLKFECSALTKGASKLSTISMLPLSTPYIHTLGLHRLEIVLSCLTSMHPLSTISWAKGCTAMRTTAALIRSRQVQKRHKQILIFLCVTIGISVLLQNWGRLDGLFEAMMIRKRPKTFSSCRRTQLSIWSQMANHSRCVWSTMRVVHCSGGQTLLCPLLETWFPNNFYDIVMNKSSCPTFGSSLRWSCSWLRMQ